MTSLVAGAALLVTFVLVERRVESPLLPLRVVTDRSRAVAYVSVCIAGIAMFGLFLFLTFYLQEVKGMSPVMSGLAFLPMVACIMISSNTSSMVTLPRFGPRVVITIGMSLGCLGLAYLAQVDVNSSYAASVLPALLLMGIAMGMVMAPAMNTATVGVEPRDAGVAAALVSTMQQVGGSVGTAVLSTVAASVTTSYLVDHRGSANLPAIAATHGYVVAFAVGASLFAVGAVVAGSLFPSKKRTAALRTGHNTQPDRRKVEAAEAEVVAADV